MDVQHIFDPQKARLSRFLKNKGHMYISKAMQKAYIEISENGTEAGAANAGKFSCVSKSGKVNICLFIHYI